MNLQARTSFAAAVAGALALSALPTMAAAQTWGTNGPETAYVTAKGDGPDAPRLFIACHGSILTMGVRFPNGTFIGRVAVRYRVDNGEVETGTWEAGSDQKTISLVGAANVMPMVRRLGDASTFWLLAIPNEQPEAEFPVKDLRAAAAPVLKSCDVKI